MDHEPWTMYLGPWTMASGPWTLAPPRSCALGVHAGHSTCILVVEFRRVASWTEGCYLTHIQYMCICDIYHIYIYILHIYIVNTRSIMSEYNIHLGTLTTITILPKSAYIALHRPLREGGVLILEISLPSTNFLSTKYLLRSSKY